MFVQCELNCSSAQPNERHGLESNAAVAYLEKAVLFILIDFYVHLILGKNVFCRVLNIVYLMTCDVCALICS